MPRLITGRPAMSRISDRALVRLVRDSTCCHRAWPVEARRATISPEEKGAITVSPVTAGLDARIEERMKPLIIGGRTVHQIGLPYHWGVGSDAVVSGDAANDLIGLSLDPNTQIQGSKAGSCDIVAGRRPTGPALMELVREYQRRAGTTIETDSARITDPAAEIVYPDPSQDDPNKEGKTTW